MLYSCQKCSVKSVESSNAHFDENLVSPLDKKIRESVAQSFPSVKVDWDLFEDLMDCLILP